MSALVLKHHANRSFPDFREISLVRVHRLYPLKKWSLWKTRGGSVTSIEQIAHQYHGIRRNHIAQSLAELLLRQAEANEVSNLAFWTSPNVLPGIAMIAPGSAFRCGFAIESIAEAIDDQATTADGRRDRCEGAFRDARQHFVLRCYSRISHEIQYVET